MTDSVDGVVYRLEVAEMADEYDEIIVDVAAIRARTGLSQPAFAKRVGVPVATLRNWEQGHRKPQGPPTCS